MKKILGVLLAAALTLGLAGVVMAGTDTATDDFSITVDEVAVLDVSGALGNFTVSAPATGGDAFVITTADANTYLQYTSTVASAVTRTITAAITTGDIPAGLSLNVISGTPTGTGTVGSLSAGGQDFTTGALTGGTIITGIGSSTTGIGASDGANLTYTLTIADTASLLAADSENITITFTLSEDV